ncbi:unnamed protein product [Victoria cruziana]
MALPLPSSPSHCHHDGGFCTNSSTNHLKFRPTLFSPLMTRGCIPPSSARTATQDPAHKNPSPPSKRSIWVNPKRLKSASSPPPTTRYARMSGVSRSLNSCNPNEEEVFGVLSSLMGENPSENEAVLVLNNIDNWHTALLALRYFQKILKLKKEIILYNVTLKAYRKCKQWDKAEELLQEMLDGGITPDNITFSTIISFARLCSLPHKAIEWFEKMGDFGCAPDGVTYSAMIDTYGRIGNVEMVMSLYDRSRKENWKLDMVAFSTLIRVHGMSGNFDGALRTYEEMKSLGVTPNLVIYNTLLDSMGRGGKPWQAKRIYKEMNEAKMVPNWITYASLLRAYARARYADDALAVYREMKEKGFQLNVVLHNTLLSMCADMGLVDQAFEIFQEMQNSESCKPDSWTFSSLITIYSCSGQVSKAEEMLDRMLEAGFEPNIFVLTSLIQCYGKAKKTADVVKTFDRLMAMGITPDYRLCGCLLSVIIQTPGEELGPLVNCIERADGKLGSFVKLLLQEETAAQVLKPQAARLFDSISVDARKAYWNCLIDLCVNLKQLDAARELLEFGIENNIYTDIQSKTTTEWSLHLRSLSLGAALTALDAWMKEMSAAVDNGEDLPPLLGINTGHGKHQYSEKGLASLLESHLKEIDAPFHESTQKVGWFFSTSAAVKLWLRKNDPQLVAA